MTMVPESTMPSCSSLTLRLMTSEQSVLSRPDGSAVFHQGDTAVMAAVYGPAEVLIRKELIDRATVELTFCRKTGLPGCSERAEETRLRQTCESIIMATLHPRTCIRIVLQELQDSGSLVASAVNAACLALLDGAIPLKYTVAAVNCVLTADDQIILDPTKVQEADSRVQLLFAFDSQDLNVVTSVASGTLTDDLYQRCLLACREASKEVFAFYREALKRKLNKMM